MSQIQSIVFDRDKFTTAKARAFLQRNKLVPIKRVDKTKNKLRYRIKTPKLFKRFRVKKIKKGISLIFGFKK